VNQIKVVLFDVGGTLLEVAQPEVAYSEILLRHGYRSELESIRSWILASQGRVGPPSKGRPPDFRVSAEEAQARRDEFISAFLDEAGVDQDRGDCHREIWESWVRGPVFQLYPEVLHTLSQIRQRGIPMGVVSNWEPRLIELCKNLAISGYFDFFLISEVEGYSKPGSEMFRLALEKAGVAGEEAVHIGNHLEEDVMAAHSVGIRPILVQRGESSSPDYSPTLSSLEEVLPLLDASDWLQGRVVTGKGEAVAFTELDWVRRQVQSSLGFQVHPGTLNLRLEEAPDRVVWEGLRNRDGFSLEPESGYCAGRCYPVTLEGRIRGAIVLPMVEDYPLNIVEILAPVHVRKTLNVNDGDRVTLAIAPEVGRRDLRREAGPSL